ncbi:MAG TPA: ATP-binding protein [Pantanalinema sp.]
MVSPLLLVGVAAGYLLLLFLIAYRVERRQAAFAPSHVRTFTYLMALSGVWITGWSYLSAAGGLIDKGLPYLAIQLGAGLTFLFGWPLILKAVQIARAHRVTTLPGFLALRYGGSRLLPVLVACFLFAGTLPYIALQLGAAAYAFQVLTSEGGAIIARPPHALVLSLTMLLAVFSILFGARRADPTLRHAGLVVTLAIHAALKLIALAAVALLSLRRFPSPFADPAVWPHLTIGSTPDNTFSNWMGYLLLSMGAVVLLPSIFHVCVVENTREADIVTARWAFPLHSLVLYALLIPIALGGALAGLSGAGVQASVLVLPWQAGSLQLSLLAYLGAIAAASGMAVVTVLALTNIVMSDLLLPALRRHVHALGPYLRPLRWGIILGVALSAFGMWALTDVAFLAQFGLVSFIAAAQLAPAFFLGLVWPGLPGRAVTWGLGLSIFPWLYTALLPNLAGKIPLLSAIVARGPWGIDWLRPTAMFGMSGLDPYVHAAFWCLAANMGAILLCALRRPLSTEREQRAIALLKGDKRSLGLHRRLLKAISPEEMEAVLRRFLEPDQADSELARIRRTLETVDLPLETRQLMARQDLERVLSGPLGPAIAGAVVRQYFPIAEEPVPDALEAFKTMEQALALNRADLINRLKEMGVLNAVAERLVAERDPERMLAEVGALLSDSFQLDLVGTLLIEGDQGRLSGRHGFRASDDRSFRIPEGSVLEEAIRSRALRVLTLPLEVDPRDPFMRGEGLETLVYVPISLPENLIGMLVCGIRGTPRHVSPEFKNLLSAIASELALAIANALHRQREDQLRRQLEVTLDNLADAVAVVQQDGRIVLINDAFAGLIQASDKERLLGMSLGELVATVALRDLSGTAIPQERSATFQALKGRKIDLQACWTGLQGRRYVVSISSVPIFDAKGTAIQAVTVIRDITEIYQLKEALEERVEERTTELSRERDLLKSANEKLAAALEDLRSLEKVKAAFVNAVSHDLRIPLTGIVGYAELLEEGIGGALGEQQLDFVTQIMEASRRMTRLLNEFLDYARMESGQFAIEPRALDLAELVPQAIAGFRPAVDKKGVTLSAAIAPELPEVSADPDRITQILGNLLSNAVKFTPPGGEIRVSAHPRGQSVVLEVANDGPGIPPEALPHMFERFFQTESGRQAGGTGLGLSIVKSLVEAHGGEVWVESTPGKDTTFRFTLPVA